MAADAMPTTPGTPAQPAERITTLDILRGIALLGILLVNMKLFSQPVQETFLPVDAPATPAGRVDLAAEWLVRFLAEGKFYSLFSFLFGLGFALQLARAERQGARFLPRYLRRLLVVLAIGVLHAAFIWAGDILTLYATLGGFLLLFRRAQPRTLLLWAAGLLALSLLINIPWASAIQRELGWEAGDYRDEAARAARIHPAGDFAAIVPQRLRDQNFLGFTAIFFAPNVFAMFLIGAYCGRRRIFEDLDGHLPLFHALLRWGLGLGLLGNAVYATLSLSLSRAEPTPAGGLGSAPRHARPGGTHGAQQLPAAIAGLHVDLLWLRPGAVRPGGHGAGAAARRRDLRRAGRHQRLGGCGGSAPARWSGCGAR